MCIIHCTSKNCFCYEHVWVSIWFISYYFVLRLIPFTRCISSYGVMDQNTTKFGHNLSLTSIMLNLFLFYSFSLLSCSMLMFLFSSNFRGIHMRSFFLKVVLQMFYFEKSFKKGFDYSVGQNIYCCAWKLGFT